MEAETRPGTELRAICSDVARLFRDRIGRGPRKTRALWAGGDVLLILTNNEKSTAERTLIAGGRGADVVAERSVLQELMRPELVGIVERATGRSVATVLSATHVDPDVSVDVFLLDDGSGSDVHAENAALRAEGCQTLRHSRALRQTRGAP